MLVTPAKVEMRAMDLRCLILTGKINGSSEMFFPGLDGNVRKLYLGKKKKTVILAT